MDYPLICQFTGAPLRNLLDMKMLEQGLQPTVRVEIESQRAIVNIVCADGGVGVVDPDILSDQDRSQLCCRPLVPSLEWSLALISAKRVTPLQIAEAFLDWIKNLSL